jgi:hypothetical protein
MHRGGLRAVAWDNTQQVDCQSGDAPHIYLEEMRSALVLGQSPKIHGIQALALNSEYAQTTTENVADDQSKIDTSSGSRLLTKNQWIGLIIGRNNNERRNYR